MVLMAGYIWHLNQNISELKTSINSLKEKNISLTQKLKKSESQKQNIAPVSNTQASSPQTNANELISHQIQNGDNFAKISMQYYGTEAYANKLALLNGNPKGAGLKIGQTIMLPKQPLEFWKTNN